MARHWPRRRSPRWPSSAPPWRCTVRRHRGVGSGCSRNYDGGRGWTGSAMTADRSRLDHADVIVITGAGGMGVAVARRVGAGATVILADVDKANLDGKIAALIASGYQVLGHVVDVSEKASVQGLVSAAQAHGRVLAVVHTAGVSPVQAPVEAILRVDLLGTALMLDAFADVIAPGGAGVFIASMAGTMGSLDPDLEQRLTTTPTDQLLELAD